MHEGPITLLIVDDEEEIRDILYRGLARKGFKVLLSSNAKEALKIILSEKIDLVITDIRMPKMNGIDLLKIVNDFVDHKPKILLMSGNFDFEDSTATAIGAGGVLRKPFLLEEAVLKINEILGNITVVK